MKIPLKRNDNKDIKKVNNNNLNNNKIKKLFE